MKGSEFAAKAAGMSVAQREALVFSMVEAGEFIRWSWKPIDVASGSLRGRFFAASDFFAVGLPGDFLRMPMSPILAQKIADLMDWSLPSKAMVDAVLRSADVVLPMFAMPPDGKMASVERFVEHQAKIEAALAKDPRHNACGLLVAGHKKNVVLSNGLRKGRVAIYGGRRPSGGLYQPVVNATSHDDMYADYSHGVRFVRGDMELDGRSVRLVDVFSNPDLCGLVADSGILRVRRQPGTGKGEEGETVLKRGSKGSGVSDWQEFLHARGFRGANGLPLVVDGAFGPNTAYATKAFQRASSLPETGVVDVATLGHAATLESVPPPSRGDERPSIVDSFVQARNYTKANRRNVDVVVIHTMEAPEKGSTAENVAAWFAGSNAPRASAHYNVDSDSIVQSVREKDVAWHAPGANRHGIGIEHAGYARQTPEEWDDEASRAILRRSAILAAGICRRWAIPIVRLSSEDLRRKKRGLCGHVDVTDAFSGGKGHWDPGPHFPWDSYLAMVREAYDAGDG